eukprot:gene28566-31726_t
MGLDVYNKKSLVDCADPLKIPEALWNMRCCIVIASAEQHETDTSTGMKICYANAAALQLLGGGDLGSGADSATDSVVGSLLSQHLPEESNTTLQIGHLIWVGMGQVGMGQVGLGQVGLGQVGLGQVGMGQVGLGQVGLGQVGLGQVGLGQVGLGQVGMGQVGMGQVGRGQVGMGQVAWDRSTALPGALPTPNAGTTIGKAFLFEHWVYSDGRLGRPWVPPTLPAHMPTPASISQAQDAVQIQADHVRALKLDKAEASMVQEGVSLLVHLKAQVALMQSIRRGLDEGEEDGAHNEKLDFEAYLLPDPVPTPPDKSKGQEVKL